MFKQYVLKNKKNFMQNNINILLKIFFHLLKIKDYARVLVKGQAV